VVFIVCSPLLGRADSYPERRRGLSFLKDTLTIRPKEKDEHQLHQTTMIKRFKEGEKEVKKA
jgi:hypothetical protein